ncbi:uncharacterized protein [Penaeus vannamei]|uniref:uncharacterized protein n=1 Tax=Penaeus vannamei TaxID=6689 RepID=UPI00387F475B
MCEAKDASSKTKGEGKSENMQCMINGRERQECRRYNGKKKNSSAVCTDNIPAEICLREEGFDMWDLMVKIYEEEKILHEWRDSVIIPIYKEKGNIQDCSNYRMKLMPHTMKIWERMNESRIRKETVIGDEQFGFMPGKGITDAVFALRQLMERHSEMSGIQGCRDGFGSYT